VLVNVVCRLRFIESPPGDMTHTLMEYCEPTYILSSTLICGPSQYAARLCTKRALVSPPGPLEIATFDSPFAPLRCDQPSSPPSSKLVVMPELSCWPGLGGPEVSVMVTSSR